jgi:hypothetical protein
MSPWTTRLASELTRRWNVEEIHNVWFLPKGWTGHGPVVGLLIPECEFQYTFPNPDGGEPFTIVNRPPTNKNVTQWLRHCLQDRNRDRRLSDTRL